MLIWKRTDYIGEGEHIRHLNVHGVASESELPLCLAYNHNVPPIGRVTNICIVADPDAITGEISGDIVFTDEAWKKPNFVFQDNYVVFLNIEKNEVEARWRLAIYAHNLIERVDDAGRRIVDSCIMREVSLIPEETWPLSETQPAKL